MLREAEAEYQEIDDLHKSVNQVDPFAKDKVVKLESTAASKRTAQTIRYGEDLMAAIELSQEFREEVEQYALEL
eukprot:CAMPEP_0176351588 /NCGR_PEP_ID=MMETSP0126-20121128/10340_1 /TAXON_ID=141414 ORGANISM="Strombidinopsis acuminatum, Strain SPMC142" /NCGR_SAMPLE_ID=MMETSP0126 /ASSEMBLY_ACC=CAM_ASM_000229 /LENGTH=73 /DNA_ID=CAMNT_0017702179 /DNA_START=946 /DNA_END=1167 /DNA_ORIENTATION=+